MSYASFSLEDYQQASTSTIDLTSPSSSPPPSSSSLNTSSSHRSSSPTISSSINTLDHAPDPTDQQNGYTTQPVAAEDLLSGGTWWTPKFGVRLHEQEAIMRGHYLRITHEPHELVQVSKWYGCECTIDAEYHGMKSNPNRTKYCDMHTCTVNGCDQPRVNYTHERCASHEWEASLTAQREQSTTSSESNRRDASVGIGYERSHT